MLIVNDYHLLFVNMGFCLELPNSAPTKLIKLTFYRKGTTVAASNISDKPWSKSCSGGRPVPVTHIVILFNIIYIMRQLDGMYYDLSHFNSTL